MLPRSNAIPIPGCPTRVMPVLQPVESALLLPGDTLLTSCSYDSSSRTNVTRWVAGG